MQYKGLLATAFMGFLLSFEVFAIELGSVANSRFFESGGWTLDGDEMTNTRAKLMEPANFGPEGTVPEAINIIDVEGEISYVALSTFDVFFIGYFDSEGDNAFSNFELNSMEAWVSAGGTMIITCDDPGYDAVCNHFGPTIAGSFANPPVNPTPASVSRPIFNGPFGTATNLAMAGSQRYFDDTGGFMVLAEDQDGNPIVLEALIGDGRVVVFTDVDMIGNDTLSGGSGISNDNDRFMGNLIAYLNDEAGETFFVNAGLNGNWWGGPGRSGEGAQMEIVDNGVNFAVVLTFYSYDTEGNQIFLIAVGNINQFIPENTLELDVFITEGGMWGNDFNPATVTESPVGTALLTVYHCGLIRLAFDPSPAYEAQGYTDLEHDFVRLATPIAPCPVRFPGPVL